MCYDQFIGGRIETRGTEQQERMATQLFTGELL